MNTLIINSTWHSIISFIISVHILLYTHIVHIFLPIIFTQIISIWSFAVMLRITIFSYLEPSNLPNPTVSGLWVFRSCYENVILCENVRDSIFPIKSHCQPTQLLQGRMANRPETVTLGWVDWMTLNSKIL